MSLLFSLFFLLSPLLAHFTPLPSLLHANNSKMKPTSQVEAFSVHFAPSSLLVLLTLPDWSGTGAFSQVPVLFGVHCTLYTTCTSVVNAPLLWPPTDWC